MACATFGWPFCIDLNKFIRKIPYRTVARDNFSSIWAVVCIVFVVYIVRSFYLYVWIERT